MATAGGAKNILCVVCYVLGIAAFGVLGLRRASTEVRPPPTSEWVEAQIDLATGRAADRSVEVQQLRAAVQDLQNRARDLEIAVFGVPGAAARNGKPQDDK